MAEKKVVLVLGASEKNWRYSQMAVLRLKEYDHSVLAVGRKAGNIDDTDILTEFPTRKDIDTITVYLSIAHQVMYQDMIMALHPKRVIFNPGAENPEFEERMKKEGIEVLDACTLVMLSIGQF